MSKTSKNIIFISFFVLLIALLVVYNILKINSTKFSEDTIGNTAGNLNNSGLFAEADGHVYFSNPYDDGKLYSMTLDQTNVKKISELNAKYINAAGKYVFFFGKNTSTSTGFGSVLKKPNLVMTKNDGSEPKVLTNDATQSMLLVGNNIYYQHYTEQEGATFYKMTVGKKKHEKLLDYMINPACCYNGSIFFNGLYDNHFLYSYNLETGIVDEVWQGDVWNPIYDGEYVYYMDIRNNYRLCRYSIPNNSIEVLSSERLEFFNLYDSVIYYQVNSKNNPRLMRMNKDGSNQETVLEGIFSDVSCTSTYTYFSTFNTGYPVFCTPTTGALSVREFNPGVALKK